MISIITNNVSTNKNKEQKMNDNIEIFNDHCIIENKIIIYFSKPYSPHTYVPLVNREVELRQILSCFNAEITPILTSKNYGAGKSAMGYEVSRVLDNDFYILPCHSEISPESLLFSARLVNNGSSGIPAEYIASPLLTALILGKILLIDEPGKLPSNSWAILLSLLDERKILISNELNIIFNPHPNFKLMFACTEQDLYLIPADIMSRLPITINVQNPDREDLTEIIKTKLPKINQDNIDHFWIYIDKHYQKQMLSPRISLQIMQYALGLAQVDSMKELTKKNIYESIDKILKKKENNNNGLPF